MWRKLATMGLLWLILVPAWGGYQARIASHAVSTRTVDQSAQMLRFGKGVASSAGMTVEDAAHLAKLHDERELNNFYLAHSDHWTAMFLGAMIGQLLDPLIYIGVPEWRFVSFLPGYPTIAGIVRGSAGAILGKALGLPLTLYAQKSLQQEDGFPRNYSVATAAGMVDGGIVGGLFAFLRRRKRRRANDRPTC